MSTLQALAHDDLGLYTVALLFAGMAMGMAFLCVCLAWDRERS